MQLRLRHVDVDLTRYRVGLVDFQVCKCVPSLCNMCRSSASSDSEDNDDLGARMALARWAETVYVYHYTVHFCANRHCRAKSLQEQTRHKRTSSQAFSDKPCSSTRCSEFRTRLKLFEQRPFSVYATYRDSLQPERKASSSSQALSIRWIIVHQLLSAHMHRQQRWCFLSTADPRRSTTTQTRARHYHF